MGWGADAGVLAVMTAQVLMADACLLLGTLCNLFLVRRPQGGETSGVVLKAC